MATRIEGVGGSGRSAALAAYRETSERLAGVFRTLVRQHAELMALLERLQKLPSADTRRVLWPQVCRELLSHERAELKEVWSALARHPSLRDMAARHRAETSQLEDLVERIHAHDPAEREWSRLFDALVDLVGQHTAEEDAELFPRAQAAIGEDRAWALDGPYRDARQVVKQAL